ncbi:breast cancer type 2 susceptibility protein isoform X2 [Narcine bancroftii]|uniref:breast cancer type 2 susceptibility protein isoform X2 n=1 Tax=Narcine bancroftii TaxID=1343680 RepID=UPI0038312E4D
MKEQNSKGKMFDFVTLCQKDLGPLCQNWFEELTVSASSSQFKQAGGDIHFTTSVYNNDYFKTPCPKQTLHSQLDCTPSIFSGLSLIVPSVYIADHRNEQNRMKTGNSFTALVQGTVSSYKGSHHKTSSPVFDVSLMKRIPRCTYATQNDGSAFFSPPVTGKVISEQILESLGAEVDPDMSWNSSLATPPTLTPTVIICKAKESELLQDEAKEVQVPLLLHSNLNVQCKAFAFGQHVLPAIGEEENEEIEGVDQSYSFITSAACGKNEGGATPESSLCIDLQASENHDLEVNESVQDTQQFFEKLGKIKDVVMHTEGETVHKLSHGFNNARSLNDFMTPLKRGPSRNKKSRNAGAARLALAKRLNLQSKPMITNGFDDAKAEDTEESCSPTVYSVKSEKVNISENTVVQNNERPCIEFRISPLNAENGSPMHHEDRKTKSEDFTNSLNRPENTCIVPFSAQLSTNEVASTSVTIHTISSHSSCVSNILHKTEQLCLDSEKYKRSLKNDMGVSELQIKSNIETLSVCLSQEKCFEGSRKIALLASTLKSKKLNPDLVSDAFLISSTALPECEYKENVSTNAKNAPCNLPSSILSGCGMTGNKSSKLIENLHNETRAPLSAPVTKMELYEQAEITSPPHNTEPCKGENIDRISLKPKNLGADSSAMVMIKEACTVLKNAKELISKDSEVYKCGTYSRNLACTEQCTDLLTENLSHGKLFKIIEKNNLEANSAQGVIHEFVSSKNVLENQTDNFQISSTLAEVENKSRLQITMEVVKQPSFPFTKLHNCNSSASLSQKNIQDNNKCLTPSQAEDVNKLFSFLENTSSQSGYAHFEKQSVVSDRNKETNLLIEQMDYTHPSALLDKCQDAHFKKGFDVESSMMLNSKSCNSQLLAETSSEISQLSEKEMDQTIPNKHISSYGFKNENKETEIFTVTKFCINATELVSNNVKMHTNTMLTEVIPPLKEKVGFKGDHEGFYTASGSKIILSDKSLKNAENIFRDIGSDTDCAFPINGLSHLLNNSVIGSKTITHLSDTASSKSFQLHPAIFNLNSKNSQNVLQNERKITNSDRKYDFQRDGDKAVNVLKEGALGKAMHLHTGHEVLENSDGIDSVKLSIMKNTSWKKNMCQSGCSATKGNENMEASSEIEQSVDDLYSTFAGHIISSAEAMNTEESNDTRCFQTANGKGIIDSKNVSNEEESLLQTIDCCSENLQMPKLFMGIAKNASQQLDKWMNTSQERHLKKSDVDVQLCDQKQSCQVLSNHLVSPAFIIPNRENYEACNSFRNMEEINQINSPFAAIESGMKGFQTASGKMVTVCKASLDKAKALFDEKELLNEAKCTMENISSESLQPNIGNPLIQSAVQHVGVKPLKNNYSNVNSKSHSRLPDQREHVLEDFELDTGLEMKAFQLANGKNVSVSKLALNKGRALFFDDDHKFSIQHNFIAPETFKNVPTEGSALNDTVSVAKPPYTEHFASSSSSIAVGETHFKRAEEEFSESEPDESRVPVLNTTFDYNQGDITVSDLHQHFLKTGPIAFFSTASGKPVHVSEESLKKCKQIFTEVVVSEKESEIFKDKEVKSKEKRHSSKKSLSPISNTKASLGINMSSGKPVLVSDVAFQKVKCTLKEFEIKGTSLSSAKSTQSTLERSQQLQLFPTSSPDIDINNEQNEGASELIHRKLDNYTETASNIQNPVQVESSKNKINNPEINRPTENLSASCSNTCILMSGFQTAKGKEVKVEESSLTMARIQLTANQSYNLNHPAEKCNILTEGRNESICSVKACLTPTEHPSKSNCDTNPKVLGRKVEKWTVKSSKAGKVHDEHFDFMSGKSFRCTHAFTDRTTGSDLRNGKRPRSEENFSTEEPLPKRQLLSEFNSPLQCDHKSTLKPLKCNPEGVLDDRRKFVYNIPLKYIISAPLKDENLSNHSHQQMIPPNVNTLVHKNSVRQGLHLHRDVKLPKGQVSLFKPPFHSYSGCHRQQNKNKEGTLKSEKKFLPPFKTVPKCDLMEEQVNMEIVVSSVQNESESCTKASNSSGPLQDSGQLKDDPILSTYHEIKLQSISGISEKSKSSDAECSRVIQNWRYARNLQEMRLIKKKRQTIHPQPGSLNRSKSCASKVSLHTAVEGKAPTHFTEEELYSYGVSRSTLCVRSENAESFQINSQEFFSEELLKNSIGLHLADGSCLIPDDNGMAGKYEFYRALLDTPGVDSNLISEVWAFNHYKWLIWKLAAMEIAFPKQFGGRCLTPERILLQLKYRYDVEIDQGRRSALTKIMERDDIAAKSLVLCISKIITLGSRSSQNNQNLNDAVKESKTPNEANAKKTKKDVLFGVIEVTDGWYGIKALLDSPLTTLLRKRRLVVGQKIIVHGAELIGSQDPCSPLEAPESLMLKISANSTRPARWYTKLGFHCDPRPFLLPLSSLFCEGGTVGCIDVIIIRTYPIQWLEKCANGMYIFRNERAEEREAQIHNENQQKKLEMLYANIEAKLQDQYKVDKKEKEEHKMQKLSEQQVTMLQDGRELYEAIQNSSDPLSVEICLTEQQIKALSKYQLLLKEQEQNQIEAEFKKALENAQVDDSFVKRNVVPLWKISIMDYKSQDSNAVYMLNIWRPIPELHSLLKEGGRYWMCYLSAAPCKGWPCHTDLQLTATKKTRYQQLQPSPKVLNQLYQSRQAITYAMLCDPLFKAAYKEVDLAGYVIHIVGKADGPSTVYLADENKDLVAIKFYASFKQRAVEDIVMPGALIVASNLKWTSESYMGIPMLLAGDLSNFSTNPKDRHLREKYLQLKSSVQNLQSFIKDIEEKVKTILGMISTPRSNRISGDVLTLNNKKSTSTPISGNLLASSNARKKPQPPSATENGSKSTWCSTKVTQIDSLTELKKKKLTLLSQIPSTVPLPHLPNCISPSVQRSFRPPRRCVTPQSSEEAIKTRSNKFQVSSLIKTEISKIADNNWVTDEELAMIDIQALLEGLEDGEKESITRAQISSSKGHALLSKNVKNYLGTQISKIVEDNWVTDEELAMINTQALYEEYANGCSMKESRKVEKSHVIKMSDRGLMPQNPNYFNNELRSKDPKLVEDNWVPDEELAMINTQVLCEHWANENMEKIEKAQIVISNDPVLLKQNVNIYLESELETLSASPDKSPPVGSQSRRRRKDGANTRHPQSKINNQPERNVTLPNNRITEVQDVAN